MKRMIPCLGLLVFVVPTLATAHVALSDPSPRSDENGLNTGPCGDIAPGDAPTMYTAGETVTVVWEVGQSHGGSLRIDFATADDAGFEMNVLAMDVPDADNAPMMLDVELPDVECEACTLRVTQLNPDEDDYYSCADVQLIAAEGSTGTGGGSTGGDESTGGEMTTGLDGTGDGNPATTGDDTGMPDDGNPDDGADDGPDDGGDDGGDDSGDTGADTDGATSGAGADDDDGGGCSVHTTPSHGAWWLLFGIGAFALRRRVA